MLQCVPMWCSMLQRVAVFCRETDHWYHAARAPRSQSRGSVLQCVAACCSMLLCFQCVAS